MSYTTISDFYIDQFQNAKKTAVNAFVHHSGIKEALNGFIDGQTAYTKSAVKVATEVGTRLTEEGISAINEATRFDLSKFFKVPGSTARKSAKTESAE